MTSHVIEAGSEAARRLVACVAEHAREDIAKHLADPACDGTGLEMGVDIPISLTRINTGVQTRATLDAVVGILKADGWDKARVFRGHLRVEKSRP